MSMHSISLFQLQIAVSANASCKRILQSSIYMNLNYEITLFWYVKRSYRKLRVLLLFWLLKRSLKTLFEPIYEISRLKTLYCVVDMLFNGMRPSPNAVIGILWVWILIGCFPLHTLVWIFSLISPVTNCTRYALQWRYNDTLLKRTFQILYEYEMHVYGKWQV